MGNFCSGPMVNDRPAEFTTDIKSNNVVASPPHVEQLAEVPPEHHPHVSDPNVRPPSPSILEGRSHSYHNACGPDSKHKQLSLPQIDVLLALGNTADQTVNMHQDEVPMVELAKLSTLAYEKYDDGKGAMTKHKHYIELVTNGQYSVVGHQHWDTGGLSGGTYEPQWTVFKRSDLIVIAVKGTDILNIHDDIVDIESIVAGVFPKKMVDDLTKAVTDQQTAGVKVMITGHSLGGYAAEVMSTRLNIAGAGFMAPGPIREFTNHDGDKAHPGFRCINAYEDPIGNEFAGIHNHLQWTVYGKSEKLTSEIPSFSHKLANMVELLEGCTSDITNYNVYDYATPRHISVFTGEKEWYTLHTNTQKKTEEHSLLAMAPETVAIENLPPPSPLLEHVDPGDAVEDNTPTEVEEEEQKPEPPVVDDTTTTASASVDEPEGHDDVPPTLSTHEPDVEQLATESQEQDDDSEFPPPVTIAEHDTEEDLDVPASMHQHEATPPVSDDEE